MPSSRSILSSVVRAASERLSWLPDTRTVAVLAFKAVVQLEITRRENNKRVLLLKTEMMDMMGVLLQSVSSHAC